jgi:hypothetical protein
MDDLINSLRTGDAFKNQAKQRRRTVTKNDAPQTVIDASSLLNQLNNEK